MKNKLWRKLGQILLIVGAGIIGYGIGYSIATTDVAKWFIEAAVDLELVKGVGRAELMEYFIKLKGGK